MTANAFSSFLRGLLLIACLLSEMALAQSDGAVLGSLGGVRDPRQSAKNHTELASMYFQDGNIPVALEELRIAIAIDPDYPVAYSVRGLVRHYLRETESADDDFRRALKLNPENPEINNNYGWFLCQVGREKDANEYFLKAIKNPLYQTPDRAFTNAGLCAIKTGDLASAEDFLAKAMRLSAYPNPLVRLKLGDVYFRLGKYAEARIVVGEFLRMVEPTAEALNLAVRIERRLGDRAAEMNHLNQLRRRFPNSPEYQELIDRNKGGEP